MEFFNFKNPIINVLNQIFHICAKRENLKEICIGEIDTLVGEREKYIIRYIWGCKRNKYKYIIFTTVCF